MSRNRVIRDRRERTLLQALRRSIDVVPASFSKIIGAHKVLYGPKVVTDWDNNAPPGNTDGALDQLASRVTAHEATGIASIRNGSFGTSFNALATSNGTTVTLSLEQSGGGDLIMFFSDGQTTLDCTPAATVTLTAGTDAAPAENFVYILQSTKALTVSTVGFPSAAEHIKIGYFLVPSATFAQTYGLYINQNWNDELVGSGDGVGHLLHIAEKCRRLGSTYYSGIGGAGTSDYVTITGAGPSVVNWACASGVVYQMHRQTYPAFDTASGGEILVVNHPTAAYTAITDLASVLVDSTNTTMSGKYFNFVFIGVQNKTGEFAPVLMNLPGGSYSSQSDAESDVNGHDVFTIPRAFNLESTTGFLICRVTLKHSPSGSGTWSYVSIVDLRGANPISAGSGTGGSAVTDFSDASFSIFNSTDPTKIVAVAASGLTTGTTRTLTVPDADITIGDVTGPAAATDTAVPTYSGTTGKLIQDLGINAMKVDASGNVSVVGTINGVDPSTYGDVVGPGSAVTARLATFNGTTGKLIQDSGSVVADFATAAQGGLADSALQSADIDTLAELNAIVGDATLIDTGDSRLSDARTPTAHATSHTDGSDDIQNATAAQKGLATAAQITKLDGIETGATADQSAAEILAALLTVDGSGSLLDADLLDGNSSAAFATAAQGALADSALQSADIDTLAELNTIVTDATLIDTGDSRLSDARTPTAHATSHTDGSDDIQSATAAQKGLATATQITKLDGIETAATADQSAAEILTAIKTVDGAASGLDADLLDGNEATAFATAAQGSLADSAIQTGAIDTLAELNAIVTDATLIDTGDSRLSDARTPTAHATSHTDGSDDIQSATAAQKGLATAAQITKLDGIETAATADQSASEILTAIKTVDGAASGLDADLLDGNEATAFATSAQGSLADSAIQTADIDTLAEVNAIITDATLIDTGDSRLSDARTPTAHATSHAGGADDIRNATAALSGLATAAQITKLDAIEALADVTDATNVNAAGAVMESDLSAGEIVTKDHVGTINYASAAEATICGRRAGATSDIAFLSKTNALAILNVEDGADVTDATNVNAAGATMNADTTLAGNSYFLDEDTMSSDSATKAASQQSIKAYVDAQVAAWPIVDTNTADSTTVSNTTSETNFDINYVIPANTMVAGSRLQVDYGGFVKNNTFGAVNYTYKLKLGATVIFNNSTASVSSSVSSSGFHGRWVGVVRTGGATGDIDMRLQTGRVHASDYNAKISQLTSSIDWTAAQTLQISVTMAAASTNNQSYLELLGVTIYP